ncbi:hypothetical protein FSP39_016869 [Pinctada imbricata]|uniref:TMC domain-containing protein n=1 Tax=Pinctada imbricata TaxID=66713 RepID=A0AA88Y7U1_PINIB|nr:hypothetical protein FSP39_016869 [Pinctada imbricata]
MDAAMSLYNERGDHNHPDVTQPLLTDEQLSWKDTKDMDQRDDYRRGEDIPTDYPLGNTYAPDTRHAYQRGDPYQQDHRPTTSNGHRPDLYEVENYYNDSRQANQQSQDFYNHHGQDRRITDPEDVIPTISTNRRSNKSPKGTLIRHRRKSRKRGDTWEEPDYDDDDDDDEVLPSQRRQKLSRTKTMRQRKDELHDIKVHEKSNKPPSLTERYAQLKQGNSINAGNLADMVRESTLTRMNKLGIGGGESKAVHQAKLQIRQFRDRFTIWSGTLKEVEGKYGTAVMTYFRFIKWLMFLNLYVMVIMFCVITVPYLVMGPHNFNASLSNPNVTGYEEAISCTTEYETFHDDVRANETLALQVLDFVQGTGWMERTIMFYGVYYNKTYKSELENGNQAVYNMGLAYMLAVGASFFVSFLLVVKNAGKNVKVTLGVDEAYVKYCNKVFAGWDYCICEGRNAVTKHNTIFVDIQATLNEQKKIWRDEEMKLSDKFQRFLKRLFINFIVLCLLGGALYLIVFTAEEMIKVQQQELEAIIEFLVQYVPFLTITILNLVLPIVFQKIVKFEDYTYSTEIKITLARSILLRLASPIALIGILYKQLIETVSDDDVGASTNVVCGNKQWSESTAARGSIRCWEVYFGQQLYKLVLLDFFIEAGIIFFVQAPRSFLYKRYNEKSKLIKLVGPQEFDLPQSVVDIIYTQILCWLGLFFSPLIPFMTFIKCLLFFWVKRFAAITVSVPQDRPFKTSRSNSLFMVVLLLAFILAAVPIGYMVGNIQPSQSCGPFRVYNSTTDAVMFDVITNTVNSWPIQVRDIFQYLGTVGFFVPVFLLLALIMYYYWLLGQGYKKTEKILKTQLKLEGKDKKYLLARFNEVLENTEINQNNVEMLAAS